MNRKFLLTLLLTFFTLSFIPLAYSETIVFGPEVYTRGTGKPQKTVKTFAVNTGHVPFALSIKNGDEKKQRVSSAVIEINGIQVLGPEEFDKQIDEIRAHVKLKEQNEIAVEVRGEPGTFLTVTILGSYGPDILALADPDYVNLNQSTTVTFSAFIDLGPNIIPSSVNLKQYDSQYRYVADLGLFYDDGTHGDYKAGDNDFRSQIVINETYTKMLYYRVSADHNGKGKRVLSDFFRVNAAEIPSVTGTITPQGGTITLNGYASIIFPAGAFNSNTTVKVQLTSSPQTQTEFAEIPGGYHLPYEIRINSGSVSPTTAFEVIVNVPYSFIASLPQNHEVRVYAQIHEPPDAPEIYDHFSDDLVSTFDSTTKTVHATLPDKAFTNLRHLDDTYEAILIVGTFY